MCGNGLREIRLKIGGIVLSLNLQRDDSGFGLTDAYRSFLSEGRSEAAFTVEYGSLPDTTSLENVFDSDGTWKLYRGRENWYVALQAPALGPQPYQIAVVQSDFSRGDIHTRDSEMCHGLGPCALGRPMLEVLFVNLLSRGRGVLLHACAVSDNGQGFVFAGTSGAGKSTMTDLWKDQEGVTILSDDRVIVRERDGRFWAYGTPWHGDVKLCSAERVAIDRIFILRHGDENSARWLDAPNALTSLFARSFPTYWYQEGMAFTLSFLGRVSQAIPCNELAFLPDRSAIDFVRTVNHA